MFLCLDVNMAMRSASDPSMPEVNVRRNSGDQVSASSSTGLKARLKSRRGGNAVVFDTGRSEGVSDPLAPKIQRHSSEDPAISTLSTSLQQANSCHQAAKPKKKRRSAVADVKKETAQLDSELKNLKKQVKQQLETLKFLSDEQAQLETRVARLQGEELALINSIDHLQGSHGQQVQPLTKEKKKKTPSRRRRILFGKEGRTRDLFDEEIFRSGRIRVGTPIGKGGSGSAVFACRVDLWCCAVKELKLSMCNRLEIQGVEKEVAVMKHIPIHPNIVPLLYFDKNEDVMCLYMPLYDGTLMDIIQERRKTQQFWPVSDVKKIARQVGAGLHHLHRNGVVHRDVKSENVMILRSRDGANDVAEASIGDFDAAKIIGASHSVRKESLAGTPGFIAPEIMQQERNYDFSIDVFSFGMLLYEICTLKIPYEDVSDRKKAMEMFTAGTPPTVPPEALSRYPDIIRLHRECIQSEPVKRPGWNYIRQELGETDCKSRHDIVDCYLLEMFSVGLTVPELSLPSGDESELLLSPRDATPKSPGRSMSSERERLSGQSHSSEMATKSVEGLSIPAVSEMPGSPRADTEVMMRVKLVDGTYSGIKGVVELRRRLRRRQYHRPECGVNPFITSSEVDFVDCWLFDSAGVVVPPHTKLSEFLDSPGVVLFQSITEEQEEYLNSNFELKHDEEDLVVVRL